MAARRLMIILMVLLGISTVLALLAPEREQDESGTTTAKREEPPAVSGSGADARYEVEINANSPEIDAVGTGEIPLRVGDQISLTVRSRRPDQVEIPAFGMIAAVSRDGPATFDLLLDRPGTFDVRLIDSRRVVGRLYVSGRAPQGPGSAP